MILLLGYNMKIYEDPTLTNIECLHTCIYLDVLQYSLHIQLFLPISVAIFCCRALDTLDLFFNYIFNLRMEVSFFFFILSKIMKFHYKISVTNLWSYSLVKKNNFLLFQKFMSMFKVTHTQANHPNSSAPELGPLLSENFDLHSQQRLVFPVNCNVKI